MSKMGVNLIKVGFSVFCRFFKEGAILLDLRARGLWVVGVFARI
jgi:hypothetical protein